MIITASRRSARLHFFQSATRSRIGRPCHIWTRSQLFQRNQDERYIVGYTRLRCRLSATCFTHINFRSESLSALRYGKSPATTTSYRPEVAISRGTENLQTPAGGSRIRTNGSAGRSSAAVRCRRLGVAEQRGPWPATGLRHQLVLFCSASHSMEPTVHWGWTGCTPRSRSASSARCR